MTEKKKDNCYFLSQGTLRKCSILNEACTDTESMLQCKFYKTEKEFFTARNRAVEINREKGKCTRCKYKPYPCELVENIGSN